MLFEREKKVVIVGSFNNNTYHVYIVDCDVRDII